MGYLLDKRRSGGARQPAGRRPQRAAPERREPARTGWPKRRWCSCCIRRAIPTTATSSARTRTSRPRSSTTCKRFFKQYYAPNNASLAIVGDFDEAQTKALVAEVLRHAEARSAPVPPIKARRRRSRRSAARSCTIRVELPRVYMAWITSPIYKPGDADADIAATILGGGRSSRLYKKLVYEKQIAQDVSRAAALAGAWIDVPDPGHGASRPHGRRAREGASTRSWRRCGQRRRMPRRSSGPATPSKRNIVSGLESLGGFGGVADRLNIYNHYLGHAGLPAAGHRALPRRDAGDGAGFRARLSHDERPRVVIHAVPGEPQAGAQVADAAEPGAKPPKAGEGAAGRSTSTSRGARRSAEGRGRASPLQLPTPQSATLSNGLTLILAERRGLPVVRRQSGAEDRQRRQPARQAWSRELHGRDAR